MTSPIELPPLVLQRAKSSPAGHKWLDNLAQVVDTLAEQWQLEIGDIYIGGTAGYVAAAKQADGREVVLKVAMPLSFDEERAHDHSAVAHRIAAGRGCVALLEHSESHHAMLLERLGPNLHQLEWSVDEILDAIADTLNVFWRPLNNSNGLTTAPEKAQWLANYITKSWDELGQPCAARTIDLAVEYCGERAAAFDPSTAVLVHGDAHGWNTVQAGDSFKFVDPEGVWSERAHDLATPMREYNEPLLTGDTSKRVRQRAERLAQRCAIDPEAVWQWGYIERVSTGMANLADFGDEGAVFLEVADRCAEGVA